jgi:UDP-N-acetyl-D-galactosamine dehydrogenase
MGDYVATEVVKLMIKKDIRVKNSSILILGFTFKENCPDTRNTKVIDIYDSLNEYETNIDVYDPCANSNEVKKEYGFKLVNNISKKYNAIILAVAHNDFLTLSLQGYLNEDGVLFDVKGVLNKEIVDGSL